MENSGFTRFRESWEIAFSSFLHIFPLFRILSWRTRQSSKTVKGCVHTLQYNVSVFS